MGDREDGHARAERRMLGALVLVAACATSGATGSFFAEEWNACPHVFTQQDAQALHDVGRSLQGTDACAFDGVYVRGSQAVFAFATADGRKAEAMLQPADCVPAPPAGTVVAGPYVLRQAAGAAELCPQAMSALASAVREGRLPPPTKVEAPGTVPATDTAATPAAPAEPSAPATEAPVQATPDSASGAPTGPAATPAAPAN
jgi:hypothetical protein